MKHKAKEIAYIFNVSDQTVRNRVSQPEVAEFFSPEARRADGQYQAEFFADDIDVFNSIHTLRAQNASWHTIAENLRSGWRDTNWPERAAYLKPPVATPSNLEMATALAVTNERNEANVAHIIELENNISELREQVRSLESVIHKLEVEKAQALSKVEATEDKIKTERELGRMERELELLNSGRLKPATPSE